VAEGSRWYRVVYRTNGTVRPLGRLPDVAPTHHALDPYRSRLLLAGVMQGELLLVDEATGQAVARRFLQPQRKAPAA
jgi:hypothetical protein